MSSIRGAKKAETPEARAVKIAAQLLQVAGACKYRSVAQCHRLFVTPEVCEVCIEGWLLSKARRELEREARL